MRALPKASSRRSRPLSPVNLVQLPKAACLNPSPSYYKQFNGFTLGLTFAMGLMVFLFWLGKYVMAPYTLRGMDPEERKRRVMKFQANVMGKALLILYIGACPRMLRVARQSLQLTLLSQRTLA